MALVKQPFRCSCALALLCLLGVSPISNAEGLSDLRRFLQLPHAQDPIDIVAEFKLFGRSGEHDELIEREGLLELHLSDGPGGLQVAYAPVVVAQLHAEELAKIADENVKNSALNAVGQFDYWEWRELIYPAAQLQLVVERYRFLGEAVDTIDGRPARLLTFSLPREKIDKSFRKYVKKYNHKFKLWIDDRGVPLASELTEKGSGRIFIVIGFEFKNSVSTRYQRYGERLIATRREVHEQSSGATMQSQRHFVSSVTSVNILRDQ